MDNRPRITITLRTWLVMSGIGLVVTGLFLLASRLLVYVSTGAAVTFQVLGGLAALFANICVAGVLVSLVILLVRAILRTPRESSAGLSVKPQKFR